MRQTISLSEQETALPSLSRKGFVTNYPPFRQWKNTEGQEKAAPVNIYVHIPFCLQRCSYCYYKTNELKEKSFYLGRYVDALCREIELASSSFHLKSRKVTSIYFGGGTPTLLKPDQMRNLTECLRKNLDIEELEFTVEAEPVTLNSKKADLLRELGVNRISLGVQSFSDEILRICNRLDNEEKVLKAIELAQGTGAAVNIDLLSGLAGETPESWRYSVDRALATGAESITVYKMELYANTEYYKSLRRKEIALPDDKQELEFMQYALSRFEHDQYIPWCFFTFTKNGQFKNIYASSIWEGTDCYAFGASGFGKLGTRLYQNTNDDENYMKILESGHLPVNRGYSLNTLDEMIRTVTLGMKLVQLDLKAFRDKFGFRLEVLSAPILTSLANEGLVTLSQDAVELTRKGILYGDYSGKCVAEYLKSKFR